MCMFWDEKAFQKRTFLRGQVLSLGIMNMSVKGVLVLQERGDSGCVSTCSF